MGKLNAIDFSFDLTNRYNFWSGIIGGLFLALSYFGTDQSQVQRYLTGKSVTHIRLGLLTNGLVKVPMQFFILLLGAMVFVFYQFTAPPLFFNSVESRGVLNSQWGDKYRLIEQQHREAFKEKSGLIKQLIEARHRGDQTALAAAEKELDIAEKRLADLRESGIELIRAHTANEDVGDTNYVFLSFVLRYMPVGLLGLIIAAILAASMSSTSSELNALASTTIIDVYRRMIKKDGSDRHYLVASRLLTVAWGAFAITFAQFANRLGTLVEAVNILGSLFYGTILGIFLVAFYLKSIRGAAAFYAGIAAEIGVILCFLLTDISYLWYNLVGCMLVVVLSIGINRLLQQTRRP
jgi:SSS family solute:Na+ symporter